MATKMNVVACQILSLSRSLGHLPRLKRWHTRKFSLVADLVATMADWPEDVTSITREDADDGDVWRASA
ncbi:hypothetical protein [Sinorhizobium sp. RAC02]|uniref:hypothetical protein n=1 Tax=Sinorhizobium sp. RAC02 TaxID=1842534 RepID=UPI00083E2057|nr:hypothetical protein [Sinorhizobium sp. RAC02]AOF90406.1 hypothetical protein BSY16_991 [Sinorhizobium sp. RAC02]